MSALCYINTMSALCYTNTMSALCYTNTMSALCYTNMMSALCYTNMHCLNFIVLAQTVGRHVAPLGHIILFPNPPVFALTS